MRPLKFNWVVPFIWAATASLVVILLVKGCQTVFFGVRFPDHAFFTLIILIVFSRMATGPRELVAIRSAYRFTRKQAVKSFSYIGQTARRAAFGLAALFTIPPSNRPQTEP